MADTEKQPEGKGEVKENPDPTQEKQPGEEPPPPPPPKIKLTPDMVSQGVSQLGKTFDGAGYSYTKLVVEV